MKRSPRLTLLLVLAVFLLPLVLAWLVFRGIFDLEPARTDNEGRLVIPPQPLDWHAAAIDAPLAGTHALADAWVVLYPLPDPCAAACFERIGSLHRVHRAAGRLADRIRVAVVAPPGADERATRPLRDIHPALYVVRDPRPEFTAALGRAGAGTAQPSVYLVDPRGNIMMTYESGDSMHKLLKDLEKLLTWSTQGEQP